MWRHHFPAVFGGGIPLPTELSPRQPSATEHDEAGLLQPVAVPDLVGLPSTDARRLARAHGFSVTVEEHHSSEGLWGRVLSQDPAPGASGAPDSILTLSVGTRPRVPVPDVRGRDEEEALSILREAGLGTARRAIRSSDRVPEGCVVRTRPRHGAEVATGSRISYVVASSPREDGRGRKHGRRAPRAARLADGSFLLAEKGLDRSGR
jgi:serine/threonine-protein kinase